MKFTTTTAFLLLLSLPLAAEEKKKEENESGIKLLCTWKSFTFMICCNQ